MIAKIEAFRVEGVIFETKKLAEEHVSSIKITKVINQALPGLDNITGPFIFNQLADPQKRRNIKKLADDVGKLMGDSFLEIVK